MRPDIMILVENSKQEHIHIPARNFPILPVGSIVDLYFEDENAGPYGAIEMMPISFYSADTRNGIEVFLKWKDDEQAESHDKYWDAIAALCIKDKKRNRLLYPKVKDFSCPLLRLKKRKRT
jgi:hypothetical protein